jgi:hypothetical protein
LKKVASHFSNQKIPKKGIHTSLTTIGDGVSASGQISINDLNTILRSLSLLNKVDMESTIDTMNYQNKLLKTAEFLNELNQNENNNDLKW